MMSTSVDSANLSASTWEMYTSRSYAPYSGRSEVVICQGVHGLYPGVRIENASYPCTIEALQGAFGLATMFHDPIHTIWAPPGQSIDSALLSAFGASTQQVRVSETPPTGSSSSWMWVPNLFLSETSLETDSVSAERQQWRLQQLDKTLRWSRPSHSHFPVAALLETDLGIIRGANTETSIWPLGLCAERNAIHAAKALGAKPGGTIMIHAPNSQVCSPCGTCRQTMFEIGISEVYMVHGDLSTTHYPMASLLPFQFQSNLENKHEGDRHSDGDGKQSPRSL